MWHNQIPNISNQRLEEWAKDPSSTCRKCSQLALNLISIEKTANWPLFSITTPGYLRTSLLSLDQKPWMFAQAWVADSDWQLASKLQQKDPLGSWLFKLEHQLLRSNFAFASKDHFTNLTKNHARPLIARHSYFNSESMGSLLLLEVFLQHRMWV